MPTKKFIFSADDFGKSKLANRNILQLLKLNRIDRVAVLVKGKYSQEEIRALLDSSVKLDVHLDLPKSVNGSREVVYRRFLSFV